MGLMIDSNVLIVFEKHAHPIDFSRWNFSDGVFISAIVVAELLAGVHRANTPERKRRREAFVEAIISEIDVLDFTTVVARVHAEIHAELAKSGQLIGAHDLLIAATARHHNLALLTDNVDEFSRVPALAVVPFTM